MTAEIVGIRGQGFSLSASSEDSGNQSRPARAGRLLLVLRFGGWPSEQVAELTQRTWRKSSAERDGGLDRTDINELNHTLRRTLRSHGGDYAQPIELVNQHLTPRGRPAGA